MNRTDVSFLVAGHRLRAWHYQPETTAPRPIVVMAHGLGGTRGMRLDAYAERFAAAGYGCLVFDYRHFGDSEGNPRNLLSVSRQLQDWTAAINCARSLSQADPDQVVVWGSSFGGGHALTMAARDHRLAAAIAQCPFTDGVASALAVPLRTSAKVTVAALRDLIGAAFGRPPVFIPTAGAPGSTALMTAPDAQPGYLALVDADDRHASANTVTARTALDILRYAPGRHTADITCPVLFALCKDDSVAPEPVAQRQAARAPRGEIRLYPFGHFEIYLGEAFESAVGDQIRFLRAHVPVA